MEFYWGHAAAASPSNMWSNAQSKKPPQSNNNDSQSTRATTSSSNLTTLSTADSSSGASSISTATPRATKKSRIPGHRRTTSIDTAPTPAAGPSTYPSQHETPRQHLPLPLPLPLPQAAPAGALSLEQLHHHLRQAHSPGGTPSSGGGVTTSFFPAASPESGWPAAPSPSAATPDRDRLQEKQLPATPLQLDTRRLSLRGRKGSNTNQNTNNNNPSNAPAITPIPSSESPLTASSTQSFSGPSGSSRPTATAAPIERSQTLPLPQHAGSMLSEYPGTLSKLAFARNESASTISGGGTAMSTRTMNTSETGLTGAGAGNAGASSVTRPPRPFVVRNGRTFLSDPTLAYPLPVDLAELHRQSLRTLLLFQLFGGPVCSPEFENRPPVRVLEVGCGSGFWSMMCHRYYSGQGHKDISFTGMDMAPFDKGMVDNSPSTNTAAQSSSTEKRTSDTPTPTPNPNRPQKDMKWTFVQHDMRRIPWPLPDEHFDLVMVKDLSLAITNDLQPKLVDEYLRVLRPGGVLEIWESDHTLRMLRPHVPEGVALKQTQAQQAKNRKSGGNGADSSEEDEDDDDSDGSDEDDEYEAAAKLGAYIMSGNTPLSPPLNNFIVEYNGWISKALEARSLTAVPCTGLGPMLLQEAETLGKIGSRRLAVPLSEVKWEREGVGGVVTKDGKSYVESSRGPPGAAVPRKEVGSGSGKGVEKRLSSAQAALRRTALLSVVQQVQSLEAVLREVSGKSQDEWDAWIGKMMNDLMRENGTSWGECMEVGAWWATKKRKR